MSSTGKQDTRSPNEGRDIFFEKVRALLRKKGRAFISIDGRCGSGKTSLAGALANVLNSDTVHMDDYYMPFRDWDPEWRSIPAGNMDLMRLRTEILEPFVRRENIVYRAYDCPNDRMKYEMVLPLSEILIVEGSYSQHPLLRDMYDIKLFVTADRTVQEQRLKKREGDHFKAFSEIWIPMEELYFKAFGTEDASDCRIDTSSGTDVWEWQK